MGTLNFYTGAYITDDIYVGMTYNELKEKFGDSFKVHSINDSLGICAEATIGSREWTFAFNLTEKQMKDIYARIDDLAKKEPNLDEDPLGIFGVCVDISDIEFEYQR